MNNSVPALSSEDFEARFAELYPALTPQAATVEASRCLFCYDAPCTHACPTHIDVPRFIKKITTGNTRGSALTILDANVLGASCARVCPVEVLCEGACVMHHRGEEPIQIARLQRHAMDWFYDHSPALPVAAEPRRGAVGCIGAGPASLACSAELRRHGYAVVLIDRRKQAGGLNTYGIAEYKMRPKTSLREVELVRAMGVEFRLGVDVDEPERLEAEFDFIFLGVGLGHTHRLGIPGENLEGVVDALSFIEAYKTGRVEVGRRVVVIGAGNTAIDAATAARRLGASEVHIVYRRNQAEMSAFAYEYEIAKRDSIQFHWNLKPERILGSDAVQGIALLGAGADAAQRVEIACDMVIPSIGQMRLIDYLKHCRGVELIDGRVVVDAASGQTANPRYFAGGDCVNGGREVVDAVAEGKRAARGIAAALEAMYG